jgi:G3E family GTPase
MACPVYLFTGFLDSGKTTLIKDTLNDEQFMDGISRTLIICFEQGETEYTNEFLDEHNAFIEFLDASTQLTVEKMHELDTLYHPDQVFIEYNGSESVSETLLTGMPDYWPLVEILTTVDASTFAVYISNMRSLMFE